VKAFGVGKCRNATAHRAPEMTASDKLDTNKVGDEVKERVAQIEKAEGSLIQHKQSMISRQRFTGRDKRTNLQKQRAVLSFLNHPNLSQLSDREISRRTRVSQPFVSKLRKFVISQGGPTSGLGLITPPHGTDSGHPNAVFDSSTLTSHNWATARHDEQRRFVDAVGLRALCNAAPSDHRDVFVASLLAQISPSERPAHLPTNVEMYLQRIESQSSGGNIDVPAFLRRKSGSVGSG
jgi:hypothetical protein